MARRGIVPAPWPVLHTPRSVETVIDAHGNSRVVDGGPVIRRVIEIYGVGLKGSLSSDQLLSNEYLADTKVMYHMVIPREDINFYNSGDQVLIFGSVTDGAYEGGQAFRLDGKPSSDSFGPWPNLYKAFGGYVKIVRGNSDS